MGLGDILSRVIVEMKGDTSDLKAKLRELSGIEKERTEKLLADIDRQNKGWTSAVATLGHVGLAMDTLGKFTDFARSAMREFGEHTRLATATAGVNIDKLSDAFGGLVSQHELLTFAAQTSNGVLALTQGQMETVGQAAVALRNRGFDLEESLKKLTDAAVKGKVGGLDDLGLSIKEGASKAETLRNMMRELNKVIAESGSSTKTMADDIQRASTQWNDMTAAVRRYSAEAFVAMDTERMIKDTREKMLREGYVIGGIKFDTFDSVFYGALDSGRAQERYRQGKAKFDAGLARGAQKVIDSENIDFEDGYTYDTGRKAKLAEAARKRAQEAAKASGVRAKDWTDLLVSDLEGQGVGQFSAVDAGVTGYGGIDMSGYGDMSKTMTDSLKKLNELNYESFRSAKQKTFLESTFGELEDFNAYSTAFGMLTGSVSAGLNAWIDGSMSAGQAIKKFLADALKGLASQMAVEALKHGAYAIGSLAFGDVRGAGQHAAAAAAFGAGAAVAATAARELGGGGGNSRDQRGAGGAGGGRGDGGSVNANGGRDHRGDGGGGGSNRPIVMIVGSQFDEMTPRQRRQKADEVWERARRERDE